MLVDPNLAAVDPCGVWCCFYFAYPHHVTAAAGWPHRWAQLPFPTPSFFPRRAVNFFAVALG